MKKILLTANLIITLLFIITAIQAQQLAFPGAEGFGRYASGGRHGTVYHVTNLNDAGTGSFRDAVSQPNRIVVFDVGGVIKIGERVVISKNITIAGQTAPGDGIVIYGNGISCSGADSIIIRYLRVRMGVNGTSGKDALALANGKVMIFDHVSASWGRDETFSINWDGKGTEPSNITIQNSIIGQGLETHSCGGLIQTDGGVSIIRCLYIDNKTRNPKVKGVNQFVNNVVYNWGSGGGYIEGDSDGPSYVNVENNYFVNGPSSPTEAFTRGNLNFHMYAAGNYQDGNKNGILDGVELPVDGYGTVDYQTVPYNYPAIAMLSAPDAFTEVLNKVGASLPTRDQVDTFMLGEVKSYGLRGATITSEKNLPMGGPGIIFNGKPRVDTDNDGMPDDWEIANGLDLNDPTDYKGDKNGDGYINLENYINSINAPVPFLKNPVNLSATPISETQVDLTWQEFNTDETGFSIERSENNVDFTEIAQVAANTVSYSDNGLTKNTTYYYRVMSLKNAESSLYSNTASAKTLSKIPINPVPDNNAQYINPKSISFSWTASASEIISFKFYLGTDPNNLAWQADISSPSYVATNLTDGTVYYWRVDAVTSTETLTGDAWTFTTKKVFPLGLVAHWKLNEAGGDVVSDSSGYHNDGDIIDMDNAVWESGISGNSLNFKNSETTSHVLIQHSDELYFDNNPFTISLWMKAQPSQGECYLIHKGSFAKNAAAGTSGKWFGIQIKGSLTFAIDDDVTKTNLDLDKSQVLTDQWVHLVAVRDTVNKKIQVYKNGILWGEKTDATKTSIGETETLKLGNSNDLNVPFKGSLDDVRIYNKALSASEILDLFDESVSFPEKAINPSPADNATYGNIAKQVLSWSAGAGGIKFDVYLGSDPGNLSLVSADQTTLKYTITTQLNYNTKYYWRIDSKNSKGTAPGDVWSFTTKKQFPVGLVGNWRFEEPSGTVAADSSQYHQDGTIQKLTSDPVREPGRLGNCLNLSNSRDSSSIMVPFADHLFFDTNPFTISLWMKWDAPLSTSTYLIQKGGFAKDPQKGTNGKWYGIEIKGANLYFSVDDDVTKSALSTTSAEFCTGQWVHVVAIRDTTNKVLKLYRNGTKVTELADNTGSIENFENVYIANCQVLNTPFPGSIDEVRLYNYALSDNEIQALYSVDHVNSKAINLTPADLSVDIDPSNVSFSWSGDVYTRWYTVNLSTDKNALTAVATNITSTGYSSGQLLGGTTYYWRIDAGNYGYNMIGDTLSFTTAYVQPLKVLTPTPSNAAINVDTTGVNLSWIAGTNATWFDVYFGTSESAMDKVAGEQTAKTYTLPALKGNTTYYWRVDAGNPSFTTTGDKWSFTTKKGTPLGIDISKEIDFSCYPNPFTDVITLKYRLDASDNVNISIFDTKGKLIAVLADGYETAGNKVFVWHSAGTSLNPGIYFCSIKTSKGIIRKKLVYSGK